MPLKLLKGLRSQARSLLLGMAHLVVERYDGDPPEEDDPYQDPWDSGTLTFHTTGRFVDGTSLRDLMAGITALTAIWCATDEDTASLERAVCAHGPYDFDVQLMIEFYPSDNVDAPVYNASALLHKIQLEHGVDVEIH